MNEVLEKKEEGMEQTAPPTAPTAPLVKKKKKKSVWKRIVALVLVVALILAALKFCGKEGGSGGEGEVMTDIVSYGSITSVVEGSGITKAKTSETLTLSTVGTVLDVFVTEGQTVAPGDPLFTIDSPSAETAVQNARNRVEGLEKQLSTAYKDIAGLNLAVPYSGKVIDVVRFEPGDEIGRGKVATLVDDTKMRLKQYYSYAYADAIHEGMTMTVSLPGLMSSVEGTVEEVHMVSRITSEGSKLFSADVVIPNAGVLAVDMEAAATAVVNGETIYPYEAGKLEYYRVSDLNSTVEGEVIESYLVDWLSVSEGEVVLRIDGESSEAEIFTIEQNLETAREELEAAEKNFAFCDAVAPIAGKIIGLSVVPGQELAANTALVTISDTSTITVNATVDERNIGFVKAGMSVELDQWGTMTMGTVESISLSSNISNGVATYPIVISADNSGEMIQINSYINYRLNASQSENCLVLPIQCVRTVGLEDGSMATVVYVKADSEPENAVTVMDMDMDPTMIPAGFYPVAVEIGIQDRYNVELLSGVSEGDEVFTQMMTTEVWG